MASRILDARDTKSDAARLLLVAARERVSVAAIDLLLPPQVRLTEWQRATAAALLTDLIRGIEEAMRAPLADHFAGHEALSAALSSTRVAIAQPLLERAHVLGDIDIGHVLVRRVEEHRFYRAAAPSADLLKDWIGDHDAAIASAAMALLIARSRRFDAFHDAAFADTELPADVQHRLVWMIAAALRHYMVERHGLDGAAADAAIAPVAGDLIAGYDEGDSFDARAARLVRALDRAGRLDDDVLVTALEQGLLPLFLAALALRAGFDPAATWEVLSDPRGRGPALLLRAAGVARDEAAQILLVLASPGRLFADAEGDAAAAQLDLFDATDPATAAGVLMLWRVDPAYRGAIARLSTRARTAA